YTLKNLGWRVPEIAVIDKAGPAANWDGNGDYTDGDTILGTTPLEDVGFPYDSLFDKSVDEAMLKLSYIAFLVHTRKYAEWVDRLLTPPSHAMLADYLKWVFKKIGGQLVIGEVSSITRDNNQWQVACGDKTVIGGGLVITGAGDAFHFPFKGEPAEAG